MLGITILNGAGKFQKSWKHVFEVKRRKSSIDDACCGPENVGIVASFKVCQLLKSSYHIPLCIQWNHERDYSRIAIVASTLAKRKI